MSFLFDLKVSFAFLLFGKKKLCRNALSPITIKCFATNIWGKLAGNDAIKVTSHAASECGFFFIVRHRSVFIAGLIADRVRITMTSCVKLTQKKPRQSVEGKKKKHRHIFLLAQQCKFEEIVISWSRLSEIDTWKIMFLTFFLCIFYGISSENRFK